MKPEPLFRLPSLPHSSCCFKCQIWSGACLVADLCSLEMAFQKGGCKPWLGCSVNRDWGLGIYLLPCPQELIPALQPAWPPTAVSCSLVGASASRPQSLLFLNRPASPTGSFPHLPLHPPPPLLPCFTLSVSFPAHFSQPLLLLSTTAASSLCGPVCSHLSSSSSLSVSPSVPASEPRGSFLSSSFDKCVDLTPGL